MKPNDFTERMLSEAQLTHQRLHSASGARDARSNAARRRTAARPRPSSIHPEESPCRNFVLGLGGLGFPASWVLQYIEKLAFPGISWLPIVLIPTEPAALTPTVVATINQWAGAQISFIATGGCRREPHECAGNEKTPMQHTGKHHLVSAKLMLICSSAGHVFSFFCRNIC